MNTELTRIMIVLALVLPASMADATDRIDGRDVYQEFKCGLCHGNDGRTPKKDGVPRIAGLDRVYLVDRTTKMAAAHAHIEALGDSCAQPPTKAQILAVAEWVSALAK